MLRHRRGRCGSAVFSAISLRPGRYLASVRGNSEESFAYRIELEQGPALSASAAIEPNDRAEWASPLGERPVRGNFGSQRTAWFALDVTGDPGLWRFQANGDALTRMEIVHAASGRTLSHTGMARDGLPIQRLERVQLYPGRYHVGVSGVQGSYLLRAIPLGPPDPGYEREPNDDPDNAGPIVLGRTMQGVSSHARDEDHFEFFLPGPARTVIALEPPADGEAGLALYWGGDRIFNARNGDEAREYTLSLPPGEYRAVVSGNTQSALEYGLRISPVSPWSAIAGEPLAPGRPFALPAEEEISLSGSEPDHWFYLPVVSNARE